MCQQTTEADEIKWPKISHLQRNSHIANSRGSNFTKYLWVYFLLSSLNQNNVVLQELCSVFFGSFDRFHLTN